MSNAALHSCAVLALLAGCKRAPPAQPRYCDQDLSGVWVNASAPSFAYRLEDQGTSVRGEFFKREVGIAAQVGQKRSEVSHTQLFQFSSLYLFCNAISFPRFHSMGVLFSLFPTIMRADPVRHYSTL